MKKRIRKILLAMIPVANNYIFFESEGDFSENARAVYDYMRKNGYQKNHKLIWNVKNPGKYCKEKNVIFINRNDRHLWNRMRWFYYMGRVKYFLFTHPYWLHEWKKNQVVINLAHGNPFKGCKHRLSHVADYVLASSEDGVKFRKKEYLDEPEIVVLGPPRNDWLFSGKETILKYTKGVGCDRIIFCLPTFKQTETWKDSDEVNPYSINTIHSKEELYQLNEVLKSCHCMMICKIHHLQAMKGLRMENLSNIRYLCDSDLEQNGDVLYQLLAGADALLTDFSSVYMDYLLLNRPVGFFADTVEEYTRGFTMENPLSYMPGEIIKDYGGLIRFIQNFDKEDLWREKRVQVCNRIHKYQDDRNTERFLRYFNI